MNRCYALPSLLRDETPPRRRACRARSTAVHCCLREPSGFITAVRDAVRCDANAGLPEHARRSADVQKSLKAIVATKPAVEDAVQR